MNNLLNERKTIAKLQDLQENSVTSKNVQEKVNAREFSSFSFQIEKFIDPTFTSSYDASATEQLTKPNRTTSSCVFEIFNFVQLKNITIHTYLLRHEKNIDILRKMGICCLTTVTIVSGLGEIQGTVQFVQSFAGFHCLNQTLVT